MIYNTTIKEIRSWQLVDGWRVDPETKTKIRIGDGCTLGDALNRCLLDGREWRQTP